MFDEYRDLIGMIEEFIDKKMSNSNIKRMKYLQKYDHSGPKQGFDNPEIRDSLNKDKNAQNEYDLMVLDVLGIQILRGYLFVATYGIFESQITYFCNRIGNELNLTHFIECHKNNIDNCRTYLTEVARIRIPPESLWKTISIYKELRNSTVHHEGNIDVRQNRRATLREYVEGHPLLNIDYSGYDGLIDLERGFCEEALDNYEKFLACLEDQLKD